MNSTVNERIKQLRAELKISQGEMANRLGMSATGIWKMESEGAKPRFNTIHSICSEFNVNKDWLISGKGEMFNSSNETEVQLKETKNFAELTIEAMEKHIETLERNNQTLINTLNKLLQKMDVNFREGIAELAGILKQNSCNTVRVAQNAA